MASSDTRQVAETTPDDDHPFPTFGVLGTVMIASPCPSRRFCRPRFIVVMGVSGTGKSTLGAALSEVLHFPFIDGDDLHPAVNVAKMSRGEPLDDADRLPWLDTIRQTAMARVLEQERVRTRVDYGARARSDGKSEAELTQSAGRGTVTAPTGDMEGERRMGVIVACSALKKAYRAVLRGEKVSLSLQTQTPDAHPLLAYFVYMKGDRDVLAARMQNRRGHFMKAGMLESQLNTLESPEGEPGVVTVSVEMSTKEQVDEVVRVLGR